MNSLYGKFGQSGRRFIDEGESDDFTARTWTEIDYDTNVIQRYRQIGTLIQREVREGESFNSHPAIAAHVTAFGRLDLWRYIQIAGCNNTFYTDTDSLVVNEKGLANLQPWLNDSELGALKLEDGPFDFHIYGAKDYRIRDVATIKGVRKNAIEQAPGVFEQDTFRGLRGMFRDGEVDTQIISRGLKHLTRVYRKGNAPAHGRITPYVFPL